MRASGYAGRRRDFDDLIRRPVDGESASSRPPTPTGTRNGCRTPVANPAADSSRGTTN